MLAFCLIACGDDDSNEQGGAGASGAGALSGQAGNAGAQSSTGGVGGGSTSTGGASGVAGSAGTTAFQSVCQNVCKMMDEGCPKLKPAYDSCFQECLYGSFGEASGKCAEVHKARWRCVNERYTKADVFCDPYAQISVEAKCNEEQKAYLACRQQEG